MHFSKNFKKAKASFQFLVVSLLLVLLFSGSTLHPIFVSVTEIEHNAKEARLEISCRIFTNDFETSLSQSRRLKLDILHPADKAAVDQLIQQYLIRHLVIAVNGKLINPEYLGYEQDEEAIRIYLMAKGMPVVKSIKLKDDILYEYSKSQMSIIHVTVNGERKSTRLNNPDDEAVFNY